MKAKRALGAFTLGLGLALAIVALMGTGRAWSAPAASYTVNTFADQFDSDCTLTCSLRDAIGLANGTPGADSIALSSGTYSLTLGPNEGGISVDNSVGDLDITGVLTITGLGPDQTYIDASGLISGRVFQINPAASSVVISGVTIMNGNALSSWGGGIYANGLAIQLLDLTLINAVIMDNHATGYGGGLDCVDCNLVLQGGEIIRNTAVYDGGGIMITRGSATLSGVEVISNTATGTVGDGGGIALDNTSATINNSTISHNTANGTGNGGGGLYVFESNLLLNGGQILSNTASRGGGLLLADSQATLDGGEISHNTANLGGGITLRYASAAFTQTGDSLIAYNVAETTSNYQGGGGLFIELGHANLLGGQILGNEGNCGGGLNIYQGNVILNGGQILSNTASENGGGVYISSDPGVFTQTGSSLIAFNIAEGTTEWDSGGGGIYARYGRVNLSGGQILGNKAAAGAGLFLSYGHAVLDGGTVVSNTATFNGGGVYVKTPTSAFTVTGSSLIAHNVVSLTTQTYHGGGGIFVQQGSAAMEGGEIEDNEANRGGGVMMWTTSSRVDMSGGEISDNTASYGGGMYANSGQVTLSGGEIVSNVATSTGGGLFLSDGQANLLDGQIRNNEATYSGGGVYLSDGGASLLGGQILDNRAQYGGGVYSWSGPVVLNGGQILSNTAIDNGGGVYLRNTGAVLTQTGSSLIANNTVSDTGPLDGGGGIYLYQGSFILVDGEIVENEANRGGGVMMDRSESRMDMSGGEIRDHTAGYGGGIWGAAGQVILSGGEIYTNTATVNGGGLYLSSAQAFVNGGRIHDNLANDDGGGVYIDYGQLTLSSGQVVSNVAVDDGGGVFVNAGTISVTHSASQINDNRAQDGGGVYSHSGDVNLIAGEIASNTATGGGGGLYMFTEASALTQSGNSSIAHNQAAYGGGVYLHFGDATLTGGQIYSNTVTNQGGGIFVSQPASHLATNGGQIIDNRADLKGGGVYVLVGSTALTGTHIVGNSAGNGGGLFVEGSGDAVLYQVAVLSNTATSGVFDGGGVSNWGTTTIVETEIAHNLALNAGWGGGIFNASNLDIFDSTISFNDVSISGAGGGLYNWSAGAAVISRTTMYGNHAGVGGAVFNLNQVQIANSTLTDNTATGAGVAEGGGALFIDVGGTAVLTHATIFSNTAGYGDGINVYSGTAELRGTVVAYNGTANCAVAAGSQLTSNGYNLEDANTCGLGSTGDITGTDPLLGALGDNGGPTLTHAPAGGSPVVDAIPEGSCTLSVDQRGQDRPYGGGCDIGAYELQINTVYLPLTLRNY